MAFLFIYLSFYNKKRLNTYRDTQIIFVDFLKFFSNEKFGILK